jgi:hypothetical protein
MFRSYDLASFGVLFLFFSGVFFLAMSRPSCCFGQGTEQQSDQHDPSICVHRTCQPYFIVRLLAL